MAKYYIYRQEEGVYRVSTSSTGKYVAEFESIEENISSILQSADKCISSSVGVNNSIQNTYVFESV